MSERATTPSDGRDVQGSVFAIVLFAFTAQLVSHFAQRMWPLDSVLPGMPADEQYRWLNACLLLILLAPVVVASHITIRDVMGTRPTFGRFCSVAVLTALILIGFNFARGFIELGWQGFGSVIARTPIQSDTPFYVAITVDRFSNLTTGAWLGFFSLVFIAPISEEIVYRGLLLKRLLASYKSPLAVVLSAVFFMCAHLGEGKLFFTFFAGLVFGYVYLRTRCLWYCIGGHILTNLNAAMQRSIVDFQGRGGDTIWGMSFPYVVAAIISLSILAMLYWLVKVVR